MVYTTNHKINKFNSARERGDSKKLVKGSSLGVLFIILFFLFKSTLSSLSMVLLSPVVKVFNNVNSYLFYGAQALGPKSALISENQRLKARVAELELSNLGQGALKSENDILTTLAGDISAENKKFLGTFAISFPPATPYDTLILDKGSSSGVVEGNRVYLSGRVMVGKVEDVSGNVSRLRLLSSPGIKTQAIMDRTGTNVEISGIGGGGFELQLPKGSDVLVDDLVVLPGLPKIIIAKVVKSEDTDSSPFIKVYLNLPFKINGNTPLLIEK